MQSGGESRGHNPKGTKRKEWTVSRRGKYLRAEEDVLFNLYLGSPARVPLGEKTVVRSEEGVAMKSGKKKV